MPVFVGAGTSSFMMENGVGLPNLTTTQRNALSGSNLNTGQIIYNTTTSKLEFYDGSNWSSVSTPFQAVMVEMLLMEQLVEVISIIHLQTQVHLLLLQVQQKQKF